MTNFPSDIAELPAPPPARVQPSPIPNLDARPLRRRMPLAALNGLVEIMDPAYVTALDLQIEIAPGICVDPDRLHWHPQLHCFVYQAPNGGIVELERHVRAFHFGLPDGSLPSHAPNIPIPQPAPGAPPHVYTPGSRGRLGGLDVANIAAPGIDLVGWSELSMNADMDPANRVTRRQRFSVELAAMIYVYRFFEDARSQAAGLLDCAEDAPEPMFAASTGFGEYQLVDLADPTGHAAPARFPSMDEACVAADDAVLPPPDCRWRWVHAAMPLHVLHLPSVGS